MTKVLTRLATFGAAAALLTAGLASATASRAQALEGWPTIEGQAKPATIFGTGISLSVGVDAKSKLAGISLLSNPVGSSGSGLAGSSSVDKLLAAKKSSVVFRLEEAKTIVEYKTKGEIHKTKVEVPYTKDWFDKDWSTKKHWEAKKAWLDKELSKTSTWLDKNTSKTSTRLDKNTSVTDWSIDKDWSVTDWSHKDRSPEDWSQKDWSGTTSSGDDPGVTVGDKDSSGVGTKSSGVDPDEPGSEKSSSDRDMDVAGTDGGRSGDDQASDDKGTEGGDALSRKGLDELDWRGRD